MAYSVLIVDDQKMVRQMFETAVKSSTDYEIAGMAQTAEEAVQICCEQKIDLVLMDVVLGFGRDGLDAAKQIKQERPEVKILLVTSMPEVSYIDRAKRIGVESFWHKEVQEQPLLDVMDRTMNGESIYPSQMPEVWFGKVISTNLTERELDVLRGLVGGFTNNEIGEKLGISERAVKKHISVMLEKTGFRSRLQLAVMARGGGLVINDDPE